MIRIGSLFTGIAGLDRGVELALARLGQHARVEWQAEKDPYARAVLSKHYPTVRRYEDVRDVDAHAPPINLLEGGFPCQDLSLAGKREGITGARSGLWSEFARCIRVLRPDLVFVENVPELAAYLGHVLGPLAELGFDARWGLFSAAEVGAPHRRERMFILAYARGYRFADPQQQVAGVGEPSAGAGNDGRARHVAHAESVGLRHRECCEGRARTGERGGENARTRPAGPCRCNVSDADGVRLAGGVAGVAAEVLANADGGRQLQPAVPEQAVGPRPRDRGAPVADTMRPRRPRPEDGAHEGWERPAVSSSHVGDAEGQRRHTAGGDAGQERRAPTPDDAGRWWASEPDVGRVVDGISSRLDARRRRARLRCLGNGVVAEQAALAFVTLAQRAGLTEAYA